MPFALYSLFIPAQAFAANKVYWSMFNGSERNITATAAWAIKDGTVAVTGLVAGNLFLTRTTAIGSGGVLAVEEGTDLTIPALTKMDQNALPAGVSARAAPTGGATPGAIISERQLYPEETVGANYDALMFLAANLVIPPGTGIRVVHGPVATVGGAGFGCVFF